MTRHDGTLDPKVGSFGRVGLAAAFAAVAFLAAPAWAQENQPPQQPPTAAQPADEPAQEDQARPGQRRTQQAQRQEDQDRQRETRQRQDPQRQAQPQQPQPQRGQADQRQRAALGVLLDERRGEGQGVLIRDVAPNSPAAQAGLRRGDQILSINGQEVNSAAELAQQIEQQPVGEEVRIQIRRNQQEMTVNATLAAQRDLGFRQQPGAQQGQPFGQGQQGFQGQQGRQANQAWLGILPRDPRQQRPGQPQFDGQQPDQQQQEQQVQQQGVEVARVYPSGPAARAGLRSGDTIVRIGEHEINTLDDLYQTMDQLDPNQQVAITVLRNGQEQELNATLAAREDFLFGAPEQFRGFREGPFDGAFGQGEDRFQGMPEHAMMLEQQRHLATQHQRLEETLNEVLNEVRQLRQEIRQLRGGEATRPANP